MTWPRNLFETLLASRLLTGDMNAGEGVGVRIDQPLSYRTRRDVSPRQMCAVLDDGAVGHMRLAMHRRT